MINISHEDFQLWFDINSDIALLVVCALYLEWQRLRIKYKTDVEKDISGHCMLSFNIASRYNFHYSDETELHLHLPVLCTLN